MIVRRRDFLKVKDTITLNIILINRKSLTGHVDWITEKQGSYLVTREKNLIEKNI